jgi:heme exporter protein C
MKPAKASPTDLAGAKLLLGVLMAAAIVFSFFVPESKNFQQPELARILFWHFPCPILSSVLELMGAWFSFQYLRNHRPKDDLNALISLELGLLFGALTMAMGIVFSKAQWGEWWQNDPRQTSYLLVLLMYAAYFMLRAAHPDPQRRAANAAGYVLAATLPMLFLVFIFPRLPQIQAASFHPTQSIMSGQIYGSYAIVLVMTLVLTGALTVWLYRIRLRVGLLELAAEAQTSEDPISYGLETPRHDPAPTPVVRPVRVPDERGP